MAIRRVGPLVALVGLVIAFSVVGAVPSAQTVPSPDERVAALKQSLQENQARLRRYEWVETTIISLKGEEKSRKQQRCYYGADGRVQKVPLGGAEPAASAAPAGRRRGGPVKQAIIENKKDDMREVHGARRGVDRSLCPA